MKRGYFWFLVLVLASFAMMLAPSSAMAQKFCVNGKCYNMRQTSGYSSPMVFRMTSGCANGQCANGQCANGQCANGQCATVVRSTQLVPSEVVEVRQIIKTQSPKIVDGNSIPNGTIVQSKSAMMSLLNI